MTDASSKSEPAAKAALPGEAGADAALVRELATVLGETNLTEIEMRRGDLRIRVSRQTMAMAPAVHAVAAAPLAHSAPAPAAARPAEGADDLANHPGLVASPMVGTAYRRPNPNAKPFVDVGDKVSAGDKVFLVEAMKTFNDVLAHKGGTVSQILVEDGQPVEFGQPMLVID